MKLQLNGFLLSSSPELQASTSEQKLQAFRTIRDILLRESDWTQVSDSPLSESDKEQWASWRSLLRNFVDTIGDPTPDFVVVPEPPVWSTFNYSWKNFDPENNALYKDFLVQTGFVEEN